MANEVSVTGNKKLKTLYKEFNKNFPYISLCVFPLSEKVKSTQHSHDPEKRISEVRTKTSPGDISIHGRTHAGNLEENFEKIFGLYAQVCWTESDGSRYYTTGAKDKMSLSQLSKLGEKEGWNKKDK
jgi:hypothetical protein